MKKVYLVRHGETFHNQKGLLQDGTTQLSELGESQAEQVAKRLQSLDFQHLIVSDYERTKQTAQPIQRLTNVETVFSPMFREIRRPSEFFHKLRSSAEVQNFMKQEFENLVSDPTARHSDEENFVDVSKRAKEAFEYLKKIEGDIVVVSHGAFIRLLTAQVASGFSLDGPMWQKMSRGFYTSNTGITTLEYNEDNDHWRILTFNDLAHFAE